MPYYVIREQDSQYCVHQWNPDIEDSVGELIPGGCHPTQAEAEAHVAAIMANEDSAAKSDMLVTFGGAIKALETPGRVGGYLVVWGSPDQRDLQGEYFTPETDFCLDWYPGSQRPAVYHHGLDPKLGPSPIGVIDTFKADDTGLWVEAQLDMRKRYVAAVHQLIERGVLHWSSGSVPNLVQIENGKIKQWPIIEGSPTPTPADWRQTTHIMSLKSFPVGVPALELSEETPDASPDAEAAKGVGDPGAGAGSSVSPDTPTNEVKQMDIRQIAMGILNTMLGARPDVQMTDEEKNALVEAAISGVGMEAAAAVPAEQMTAVAEKTGEAVKTHLLARIQERAEYDATAQKAISDAALKAMKTAPPTQRVPAFTGNGQGQGGNGNGNGSGNGSGRITGMRNLKYADLSASDLSFLAMLDRVNRRHSSSELKPYIKPEDRGAFLGELADKAGKAIETRTLTVDDTAGKAIQAIKANELDHSTQASFGDEWVPDLWSSDIWRRARLENVILPLFKTVDMPSNPFELPIEGGDPTVYYVAETTNEDQQALDNSSNPIPDSKVGSGKVQMSAKKLGLRVGFSAELEEDSIIPILSIYREQAQRTMMDSIDHVLLNGDTTNAGTGNINSDDADPADTEKYLAMDGLLHSALVEDTARRLDATGLAPSLSNVRQMRFKLLSQYALRPKDLVYLVGGEVFAKLLNLDEFLTMDKIGQRATILNGMIGEIDGSPVLTSAEFGMAEADGFKSATPGNNTLGRMATVYRPNWYVGYRRRVAVDVTYLPYYDSYQMTATVRLAFVHFDNDSVSVLYNLAV